jgi:hypothetical protein
MAENQQTGLVRGNFMRNSEIRHTMQAVGFRGVWQPGPGISIATMFFHP